MKFNANLEALNLFRPATSSDIVEGTVVFLIGDGDEMHRKVIEEVLKPSDPHKAFCADDGCRYGLDSLYMLKDGYEFIAIPSEDSICDELFEEMNQFLIEEGQFPMPTDFRETYGHPMAKIVIEYMKRRVHAR